MQAEFSSIEQFDNDIGTQNDQLMKSTVKTTENTSSNQNPSQTSQLNEMQADYAKLQADCELTVQNNDEDESNIMPITRSDAKLQNSF